MQKKSTTTHSKHSMRRSDAENQSLMEPNDSTIQFILNFSKVYKTSTLSNGSTLGMMLN